MLRRDHWHTLHDLIRVNAFERRDAGLPYEAHQALL
jgi:hypothetical protein